MHFTFTVVGQAHQPLSNHPNLLATEPVEVEFPLPKTVARDTMERGCLQAGLFETSCFMPAGESRLFGIHAGFAPAP